MTTPVVDVPSSTAASTMLAESDARPERDLPSHTRIAIIGTGFSGLGAAIALTNAGWGGAGVEDMVLLERREGVGGTWHDNSYPGCRCDVPSNLYSFSFAPNPTWSETFSAQPEIERYLQKTARDYGVLDRICFSSALQSARWDADRSVWELTTTRGSLTANFLIGGVGPLAEPAIPEFVGAERFEGEMFHSAKWRHDVDLTGRKVAVIGTGASTIQFLPIIQRSAGHVTLFQRTPPWVFPHRNRPTLGLERAAYKLVPALQRFSRWRIYWMNEVVLGSLLIRNSPMLKRMEALGRRLLARQVKDPELRAKVTPSYTPGCKRLLQSNEYYPALQRPNVTVETEKILELAPTGVVTADGLLHDADVLIYGTGFRVTDNPTTEHIFGCSGLSLAAHWAETPVGMSAYCGTTIPDFPNFFMLAGPNTGIGHTSLVVMIEAQVAHVVGALDALKASGASVVEVRPEVATAWGDEVQRKAAPTVWNSGGCSSWYLDDAGRNTTLWPDYTFRFVRRTEKFNAADYLLSAATVSAAR
jgi:cation diffusion facilitator CzcD-associated flavoprotein CzcO